MAQADGNVANASGSVFRADLNSQLLALFTQHSGNAAPTTPQAFQPWVDTSTTPATWKVRNSGNTAWITVGTFDSTANTFSTGGVTPIASGGTGQITASAAINALVPTQTANSGKALTTNGTAVSWGVVASGASIQSFISSTTYTPTAGKTTFLVFATGGGGGGRNNLGNSESGGGGGGTAIRLYSTTEMGATATITIGGGGTTQITGGSTSFDPAGTGLTITGAGGAGASSANGGAGGSNTNSLFSISGQRGEQAGANTSAGGGSFWAGGRGSGGASAASGTGGVVVILEW